MTEINNADREREADKYKHVYATLPDYRMGDLRAMDARRDVAWSYEAGARSLLDVGCGRGEMLDYAASLGFELVAGAEQVPELCNDRVTECRIDELWEQCPADTYDLVTSFDVLEHLLPGDEIALIVSAGHIARSHIVLTANNRPSVDPTTGADLHINIKTYTEWDRLIRNILEPMGWTVERMTDKAYVSETWRAVHTE